MLICKEWGIQPYEKIFEEMQRFTQSRTVDTPDELWLLEHEPVFTQGQAGKPEHIVNPHHISVVQSDRGGQVTYHGPGQLVGYCLFDLTRRRWHVRDLVTYTENLIIQLLQHYQIVAIAKREAPGVYVQEAKIASLGFRIKQGCSYHGFSLNVNLDLTPFSYIHPCGFQNQSMTSLEALGVPVTVAQVISEIKKSVE